MAPVKLYFCSPGYRGCLPVIPSYLLLPSHPSRVLWHLTMDGERGCIRMLRRGLTGVGPKSCHACQHVGLFS